MKEKLLKIFNQLNLVDKAKDGTLTSEEWSLVGSSFHEVYGISIEDAISQNVEQNQTQLNEFNARISTLLNSVEGVDLPKTTDLSSVINAVGSLVSRVAELQNKVEPDVPLKVASLNLGNLSHTSNYAFGIEHDLFSTAKRWNRCTIDPSQAAKNPISQVDELTLSAAFFSELSSYAASVSLRVNTLFQNPTNVDITVNAPESGDIWSQYIVMRQDALIAHISQVKNIYEFFPRRYNVQDKELMTNAYFGAFSQGYQKGRVFKGNVKFAPEFGYVDDVMLKVEFDSYKELERMYLGYLNEEGSSPVKWSFIEWCIVYIAQQLSKEQALRKIWGCFVKPEKDKPGHEMNAGNGVLYTLLRYYHENKLLPIDGDYLVDGVVNGSLMYELVSSIYKKASERVDDISEYEFFLNANHRKAFSEYLRDTYGANVDFTSNTSTLLDTNITINWVPYLFNYPLVLLQRKGNIQCLENLPGEMLNIRFHSDLEGVVAMSFWKEGMSATYAGKQCATMVDLKSNDMEEQDIFFNLPSTSIAADATVIKAEKRRFFFKTSANTTTKVITDITGAAQGVVYCIQADGVNPQKITKTDKFATITADYIPVLDGDYIMVIQNYDATSFLELERRVNGVRTINKTLQPNLPL